LRCARVQEVAAAPVVACNCDDSARQSLEADKRSLEKENRDLRDKITELRTQLAVANQATTTAEAAAAAARASAAAAAAPVANAVANFNNLPVASCAHQKLEFLRWQKDEDGNQRVCPFNAENYDNWEKMPPLCDYISIECLGKDNLRAAHVFGFGGPGLMIGYADTMMWEFVFAR
jgi:chromosome segregation ATPase